MGSAKGRICVTFGQGSQWSLDRHCSLAFRRGVTPFGVRLISFYQWPALTPPHISGRLNLFLCNRDICLGSMMSGGVLTRSLTFSQTRIPPTFVDIEMMN